jgi:formate hydrogenlyase subunit 3/multisubunit Na+/H+ antiporter MnhD subunit
MMLLSLLPPLPVVGPLAIAALLLMISHGLPRPIPDIIALTTTGLTTCVCLFLMRHTIDQPIVYWFGGWIRRQGFPLGIGFVIDPSSALEGALNFTVTNAVGSYLFLAGIALIYARIGALDFAALERGVALQTHDVVVMGAFALLATALLIKAAQVPFQAWLSDAHAVAPSPVSVIFSGAMVSIGIYGIAKLSWAVFEPSAEIRHVIRILHADRRRHGVAAETCQKAIGFFHYFSRRLSAHRRGPVGSPCPGRYVHVLDRTRTRQRSSLHGGWNLSGALREHR